MMQNLKLVHSMSAAQSIHLPHPGCLPVIPHKLLQCLTSLQGALPLCWCCLEDQMQAFQNHCKDSECRQPHKGQSKV